MRNLNKDIIEEIEAKIAADKKLLQSILGDLEYIKNKLNTLKIEVDNDEWRARAKRFAI